MVAMIAVIGRSDLCLLLARTAVGTNDLRTAARRLISSQQLLVIGREDLADSTASYIPWLTGSAQLHGRGQDSTVAHRRSDVP
jgi:hypothetical protein